MAPISVLLIPFPGFNTLDLNGPLEVLGNAAVPKDTFSITIAAKDDLTTASENVIIKRHISLQEAKARLDQFDVLVQPGANLTQILPHLKPDDDSFADLLDVISAFAQLGPSSRKDGPGRILLSVCTGAFFLGYAGVFDGLTATTHFLALDDLREVIREYVARTPDAQGTQVVPDNPALAVRWVDAGPNGDGVRIISSGGISCGLDATLYMVSLLLDKGIAIKVSQMMQYAWRQA